ncbi:MAG: hypothetical protein ABIJ30_08530 [bacterium]
MYRNNNVGADLCVCPDSRVGADLCVCPDSRVGADLCVCPDNQEDRIQNPEFRIQETEASVFPAWEGLGVGSPLKGESGVRRQKSEARLFLSLFFILTSGFWILFPCFAHAKPITVSFLLGDSHSKIAIEAVKAIEKEYQQDVKGKEAAPLAINFKVYTTHSIKNNPSVVKDTANSRVVLFLLIMDRQAVELAKPYIEQVIKKWR